jgi:hypothetical protein
MDCQPAALTPVARRWLVLPGLPRTLLVRRRSRQPLTRLWSWLRGMPPTSPEQRQAALLLRLQRHAVAAPHVLAMGQRQTTAGGLDSFLLTEPVADAIRFDSWLARQDGRPTPLLRRRLLYKAGTLVQRLHHASCYLHSGSLLHALAVQLRAGARPVVVLGEVAKVWASRRLRPDLARRDLARFQHDLTAAGCDREDWRCFLTGYHLAVTVSATGRPPRVSSRVKR